MKKTISYIACAIFAWAGLWVAVVADVSDDSPFDQGGLSILSAVLFCIAILIAGYGNSITWKGKRRQ